MRDRSERLKRVREIIREERITSQEMLLGHLKRDGFTVTQATLSRDLKVLRVGKMSEGSNGYYYTLPTEEELRESEKNYILDLHRGAISIDFSGNLAIIRTVTGHADTVGIALDNLGFQEILGTVAGDDTVLVVLREGTSTDALRKKIAERVPELGE
ncbi:MAG: ArgR family transcriptional regulator [Spirochaetaceae bacterium]|nr:MAG: ArgR family transcriptional regulator [Spirochaetaceae bacterium]